MGVLPDAKLRDAAPVKLAIISPWLALRVHMDAAIGAPAQYGKALWWRLCGKRLRARNTLAPLLGASPLAYQLWLAREGARRKPCVATHKPGATIVAIVDATTGEQGLDKTLGSLAAEGVVSLVLRDKTALTEIAEAIDWSEQPWLLLIAAGDLLAAGAAGHYRTAVKRSQARVAYADDDLLAADGERVSPHFKPDWNSELYSHFDYMSGACIVHATKAELLGVADEVEWRSCLVSVLSGQSLPVHIPYVLHHRKARPRPQLPVKSITLMGSQPPVTVIVPTRNRVDLLRTCMTGLEATRYPDLSVIVVDNGSDDPATLAYLDGLDPHRVEVMRHDGPFNFAEINNRAARKARSPLLCLLNNDIEVIEPIWLSMMVRQAMRDDVGAVGAQLFYPDGRTQHAGVVLGVLGGAAHAHRLLRPEEEGYFWRHQLPQFASAVTAACLVVQRDRFLAVGGFDEQNFAVAFNDVDLCMRLNQRGWQALYEPRARLVHHESVSRGWDRDPVGARRLAGELAALKRKWGTDDYVDPYHHPDLSRFSERFVVAL